MFLSEEFLSKYPDFAPHQEPISIFTYLRTYSRYLPEKGRREVWKETVRRAVEFNVGLELNHRQKMGLPINMDRMRQEAEKLFDSIFNLRQFPSGRTLWVGGAPNALAERFALANFNCAFTNVDKWEDLCDLFYLLLVGTGVGFKRLLTMKDLPPIRNDIEVHHEPYHTVYPHVKQPETHVFFTRPGRADMIVGDSKEGWVEALRWWLQLHTDPKYKNIKYLSINYNFVRPAGSKLKTFGGTASGPEPLREMFQLFDKTLRNQVDPYLDPPEEVAPGWVKARPIHILDMGNAIGYNVVVGGVRRTAELFLMSANDWECILAKYGINGIWDEERHQRIIQMLRDLGVHDWAEKLGRMQVGDPNVRPLHHRRMSNNSIAFTEKPDQKLLHLIFEIMQGEGEPGFVNLRAAAMRRFKAIGIDNPTEEEIQEMMDRIGLNPCAEVILQSKGVCNLTTVNVDAFVKSVMGTYMLDLEGLLEAQRMSTRIGLRMTLIDLELPEWDRVQKQDRLLGTSLTGWKDAMEKLRWGPDMERSLLRRLQWIAHQEASRFAKELRVNAPLLVTTVKPEGTLSLVANAVSPGLHLSHSPYYIRRIRINAHDPLAKAVVALGWKVHPEVGTPGETFEERMANARTLVIDFPVASGATCTKEDVTVEEQFLTYFRFQKAYTDHNSSNTITIRPGEWEEAEDIVFENWDNFVGVSFLSHDGGTYELAPYEAISKKEYKRLVSEFAPFDMTVLSQFEVPDQESDIGTEGCETGACPIR